MFMLILISMSDYISKKAISLIFILSVFNSTFVFGQSDGSKKWDFKAAGGVISCPAIGIDGTIYAGSKDRNLYAINPDGTKKWEFITGRWVVSSPKIASDGTIYVGSYDDNLYAINPDGTKKWEFKTNGNVRSSPEVSSNGTIYVGSWDNNIYAINPNGTKKWQFKTEGDVNSSPAIGSDETIYIGSDDQSLYAFHGEYIIANPENKEAQIGESVTLSVKVRDNINFSYQWFKNRIAIEGAVGPNLVFTTLKETDYAKYWVKLTYDNYSVNSKAAEIIPPFPPVITIEPNSINANIGDSVKFLVEAKSSIPMDYQWYKNGAAITDGSKKILTIENVEQKDYSAYSVRIKNKSGKVVSSLVELLPMGLSTLKPIITEQPKDIMIRPGGVAVFSVGVKGLEPMNYLWYKNGVAIEESNADTLRINDITSEDYGVYSVRIKNDYGKAISKLAGAENVTIKPSLSFKIDSQLRVFENSSKLSPAVFKNVIYFAENYHRGGETLAVDPDGPLDSDQPKNEFGDLYAYNNKTGKLQWVIELGSPATTSPSVGDDGNVFIATKATTERSGWIPDEDIEKPAKIHCIDNKGKVIWVYELKRNVNSKPALGGDGTIYFGSDDGYLYAVNSKGVLEWKYRTDEEIRFSPVIGSDGTIYFGSNDNNFYAVNAEGKLIWKLKTNNDIKHSAAIGDDGVIYFCTNDTFLYALKSDGKIKWELKLFGTGTSGTPAIGNNGIIYAISDYGVHAVDTSGKELWKKKLSGKYDYNPSIGFENTIVLGNQILSGITGEIIKTLRIKKDSILNVYYFLEWEEYIHQPDIYTGAGSIIGSNGNIYFSDSSFNYYCYKTPEFGIANSSWPMLGANPKRSSNLNSKINWVSLEKNKESSELYIGNNLTLLVDYTGPSNDLTYKWFKDDVVIDGENKSEFLINNLSISDSGNYKVTITGDKGEQSSNILNISIRDPLITIIGPSEEVHIGGAVKLSVINNEIEKIPFGARGDSNYKWRKNGVYIDAPHASILDIKTLTEKNAGVYQLEVTNELGVFLSEPYTLKVRDPVLNLEYPKTAIPLGEYLEIIVWSKEINISSTYEWFKDGKKIIGQTSESLIIQNLKAEDSGAYNVIVKNELGSFSSFLIDIKVNQNVKSFFKVTNTNENSKINTPPSLSLDGILHVTSNEKEVIAINTEGELKWKYTLGAEAADSPVIGSEGSVYVVSKDNNIYCINKDGSTKWIYETEGDLSASPALSDNDILYVGYGKTLYHTKINANQLKNSKHKYEEDGELMGDISGSDRRITNKSSGGLLAINSVTGELIWELKDKIDTSVYLAGNWRNGTAGYRTFATTAAGGTEIDIVYETGSHFKYSPVIGANNTIYASANEYVYSIDGNSGDILWKTKVGYARVCSPLSLNKSNQILFGTYGISHEVVTKPGGEFINEWGNWESYPPTYGIKWLESPKVTSINIETGKLQWSKPHERMTKTAITGPDKYVYLTIDSNKYRTLNKKDWYDSKSQLIKLNAKTGGTVKSRKLDHLNAPFSLVNSDNRFFIANEKTLNLLHINSGIKDKWEFPSNVESVISDINGRAFVIANNNIYLLDGISLANTDWPMANGNPQRQGSKFYIINVIDKPKTIEARIGSDINLTVEVKSLLPLKYQWFKNQVPLAGETDNSYKVSNIKENDYGTYVLKISTEISELNCEIKVIPIQPPNIVQDPLNVNSDLSGKAIFSVKAQSVIPLKYEWYKDGSLIPGEHDNSYTIESVEIKVSERSLAVIIKKFGKTESKVAELMPLGWTTLSPTIADHPLRIKGKLGQPLNISVDLNGFDSTIMWHKSGILLPGATKNVLNIPKIEVDSYGEYIITATNKYGETKSMIIVVPPDGGEKQWQLKLGGKITYSSPAVDQNGTIYVGSTDYNLYAVNPDGTKKWAFKTGDWIRSSPAIGSDGTIYIGSDDKNIYAINPDGTKKWEFKTNGSLESSPSINKDGSIIIGSNDNNLYCINSNGSQKWVFKAGDWVRSSPAVGSDGTIYVGSDDKYLYAINPDGSKKWSFKTNGIVKSSPAIAVDGTIYVGSYDDNLYAINPDGSKKWHFETDGNVISSPVIDKNGHVYFGSSDDRFYAVYPNGRKKWHRETGKNVNSSAVIGKDGLLYVGSSDSIFYALTSSGGSKKWEYDSPRSITSSSMTSTIGHVYFGCEDGVLYSIQSTSFGLDTESAWAAFGKNPERTSNQSPIADERIRITSINSQMSSFSLTFKTKSESSYTIEVTQDFKQWSEIGKVEGTGTSVKFTDLRDALFQKQYYRVKKDE